MNHRLVINTLGKTILLFAIALLLPLFVDIYYREGNINSFLYHIYGLLIIGLSLSLVKPKEKAFYAKEGFVIVALAWILLSLIGAVPFCISGTIPNFVDAVFETASGFSTTGATILTNIEAIPKSMMFWRAFTHFMGGMGVLVFVLAILPSSSDGAMHVFRAEAPGPSVGKLVSKIKFTARILYFIYIIMTLIEMIMLLFGGMSLFDSVCHAMSTAGTGGFSNKNASIGAYNSLYIEMVIAVFMFLFGINFNLYYLVLIGKIKKIFKSEEFKIYLIILFIAIITIAINLIQQVGTFWNGLRYSFFQVSSISSTTGFLTSEINVWPEYSKSVLLFLTICGACAGSTGGGIKIARLGILAKSTSAGITKTIRPRAVVYKKFDGELLTTEKVKNVRLYLCLWIAIIIISTLILGLDKGGDLFTNISASITCISNVGPGFNKIASDFTCYSSVSKIVLAIDMLMGRLEIFPIIVLFAPSTWRK